MSEGKWRVENGQDADLLLFCGDLFVAFGPKTIAGRRRFQDIADALNARDAVIKERERTIGELRSRMTELHAELAEARREEREACAEVAKARVEAMKRRAVAMIKQDELNVAAIIVPVLVELEQAIRARGDG